MSADPEPLLIHPAPTATEIAAVVAVLASLSEAPAVPPPRPARSAWADSARPRAGLSPSWRHSDRTFP